MSIPAAINFAMMLTELLSFIVMVFGLLIWLLPKEAGTYRFPTGRPFLGILLIVLGITLCYLSP